MPSPAAAPMRGFRYYDLIVGGMVAVLLCSNLIGAAKVCTFTLPLIGAITFGAGNLFFPISYIFDDVLTEVYGYARARRAIWAGFGGLLFATFMTWAILNLPPSPLEPFNEKLQPALEIAFGSTWHTTGPISPGGPASQVCAPSNPRSKPRWPPCCGCRRRRG